MTKDDLNQIRAVIRDEVRVVVREELAEQLRPHTQLLRYAAEALIQLLAAMKEDEKVRSKMRADVAHIKVDLMDAVAEWDSQTNKAS